MLKVLAAGCSQTDKNWKSYFHPQLDTSWDKWPKVFSDMIGAECKNIGSSGIGNERIFKKVMLELSKNNYDILLILWTDPTRIDIYDTHTFYPCLKSGTRPKTKDSAAADIKDMWIKEGYDLSYFKVDNSVSMLIHNMYIIQEYCKKNSIKLIQTLVGSNSPEKESDRVAMKKMFLTHELSLKLDKSCYDYPFNIALSRKVYRAIGESSVVSNEDRHFSAEGQRFAGKYFYEAYKSIY